MTFGTFTAFGGTPVDRVIQPTRPDGEAADVEPAIRVVVDELRLPVIIAFPPNRVLNELKAISTGFIHINRRHIGKSQFRDEFMHEGHLFKRPAKWSRNP